MSTLKHKQFIESRKRTLVSGEKEEKGRVTDNTPNMESHGALSPTADKRINLHSKPSRRHERPRSVCFNTTLDLIVKPYLPNQTDAKTLDLYHNDIWYTVSLASVHVIINCVFDAPTHYLLLS